MGGNTSRNWWVSLVLDSFLFGVYLNQLGFFYGNPMCLRGKSTSPALLVIAFSRYPRLLLTSINFYALIWGFSYHESGINLDSKPTWDTGDFSQVIFFSHCLSKLGRFRSAWCLPGPVSKYFNLPFTGLKFSNHPHFIWYLISNSPCSRTQVFIYEYAWAFKSSTLPLLDLICIPI